jgi:hypothetical protein
MPYDGPRPILPTPKGRPLEEPNQNIWHFGMIVFVVTSRV